MTRQDVADADGLLIATPEYNHSIPGVLKNAIDWLSRPPERVLRRKPVTILGATEGASGARLAQSALREILYSTGSLILPSPVLCLGKAADAFDDAGRLVDPRVRQTLGQLLDAFAAWIERGREVTAGVSS